MYPRIRLMEAAAVVLLLCLTAADQGRATVVRDLRVGSGNPAVEAGGRSLPANDKTKRPPLVPYSLIGALRTEGIWLSACWDWPWSLFRSFHWHPDGISRRAVGAASGESAGGRAPRPVP